VRLAFIGTEPFTISAGGRRWEGRYVQGGLTDSHTLYLEVADLDKWETGHLDERQVAALEDLGFTRTDMNFTQSVTFTDQDDACSQAGRILAAAFRIFGVPDDTPLNM